MLNLGLSSETCSGDSEPIHPFPRPNVHERFQRVIEKVSPDLLVVNYGMNDGIYHPFSDERFERYKNGINKIIEAAEQSNGKMKVILVTPPPFDPLPLSKKGKLVSKDAADFSWKEVYENYDSEVLAVYAQWILNQKSRVAGCIDLRTPMLRDIAKKRESNPDFQYAHDGVHVDANGHALIATILADAMSLDSSLRLSDKEMALVSNRQQLMRDSWLSEVGHKRPGIKQGKPIAEAKSIAEKLDLEIKELNTEAKKEK
jgi:lysophospholipase L1-like esterase